MRIALHPHTRQKIDHARYIKEFGHKDVVGKEVDLRPEAICPFCGGNVYSAAEKTRTPHFRHHPGAFCPSMEPAGRPYLPLTPNNPDPVAGAVLRAAFRLHWRRHYVAIRRLVPCLSPEEFVDLIRIASEQGVWDYIGFEEIDIPYVFLLMADFPPWTSTKANGKHERDLWLRFFYNPEVRAVEDLWIIPRQNVVLHRVSFKAPKNKRARPPYEDLLKETTIEMDQTFLEGPEPNLPGFIVTVVERCFARRPEFAQAVG